MADWAAQVSTTESDAVEAAIKPVDEVRAAKEATAGRTAAEAIVQMATLKSLSKAVDKMGFGGE